MPYKIGVFGSGGSEKIEDQERLEKAGKIGVALAEHGCTVITGACGGLPYAVANAAAKKGAEVIAFSPTKNIEEQQEFSPDSDSSIYTNITYVDTSFPFHENRRASMKYRNVLSTTTSDAAIILGGSWGTVSEFANLIDMGKTVGVLTGTGGFTDELPELCKKIKKKGAGLVLFDSDPEILVEKVLATLTEKI